MADRPIDIEAGKPISVDPDEMRSLVRALLDLGDHLKRAAALGQDKLASGAPPVTYRNQIAIDMAGSDLAGRFTDLLQDMEQAIAGKANWIVGAAEHMATSAHIYDEVDKHGANSVVGRTSDGRPVHVGPGGSLTVPPK